METVLTIIAIGIAALTAVLCCVILMKMSKQNDSGSEKEIEALRNDVDKNLKDLRNEINTTTVNTMKTMADMMNQGQQNSSKNQVEKLDQMEKRLNTFSMENEQKLENIRVTIEKRLEYLQNDNNKRLEKVRETVDEKLQKTLDEKLSQSFNTVSEQLTKVYKGLGEMQTLANGVGDLKKVLSNVKTRGILGEIQLGSILKEILAPEQFDENVATKSGSKEVVEFAVKLPADGEGYIYLPIDSKFPGDTYANLRDAYESGSQEAVDVAAKVLITRIKQEAKDISTKYIDPPNTTEFAIMFLPFEGLYSEVVNRGMVEVLQRDYKVNIAGPSTMAALLNSIQMGFKTLAVQKRSAEVWHILGEVKNEFDKFETVLSQTQTRINQANAELDKLVGVRTRQIKRKLSSVQSLEATIDETLSIEE